MIHASTTMPGSQIADEIVDIVHELALTKTGIAVHLGLMRAAAERNDAFLRCLGKAERACLERALAKIGHEARAFIHHENELAEGRIRRAS